MTNITLKQVHLLRKIGWYIGIFLIGLGIWDLWGLKSVGSAISGIGMILLSIKLPNDIITVFPNVSPKKARIIVIFSIAFLITVVVVINVYSSKYYFYLIEKAQENCNKNVGAVAHILRIARLYPSYRDEICASLAHTVKMCSEENQKNAGEIIRLISPICNNQLNLQGIKVPKAVFAKISLLQTSFVGANLYEVDFWQANLNKSDFDKSILDRANLRNVQCKECRFIIVSAKNVDARGGNFSRSYFGWGNWEGSLFDGADISQSIVRGAAFQKVSLKYANMERVDGRWAVFNGSDLQKAKLINGDLRNASFAGANLRGADFSGAKFEKTNFCGADLRDVKGLEDDKLQEMITDDKTQLPENFKKP